MTELFNVADRVDAPGSAQVQKVDPVMSNNDIRDARNWIDYNSNKQAVAGLPDVWAPEEKMPLTGSYDPEINHQVITLGSQRWINQPELNRQAVAGSGEDVWAKFDQFDNISVNGARRIEFGSKEWAEQAKMNRQAFEKFNGIVPGDRNDDRGFPPVRPGKLEEEERVKEKVDNFETLKDKTVENLEKRADDPKRNLTKDEREVLKKILKAIVMDDDFKIGSIIDDYYGKPEGLKNVVKALQEDLAPYKIGVGLYIGKGEAELVLDPGGDKSRMVTFRSEAENPLPQNGSIGWQPKFKPEQKMQHLSDAIISKETGLPLDEVIRRDNFARENDPLASYKIPYSEERLQSPEIIR